MRRFDWKEFWERHPKQFFGTRNLVNMRPSKYSYQKAVSDINKHLGFQKEDTVLDVGCGTGEMLAQIAPKVKTIFGVDQSASIIQVLKSRYDFSASIFPAHKLPFPENTFTKVICMGVIQHITPEDFEPSLKEMYRVLAVGGKLLIGDVLEKAPEEAGVYVYQKEDFEKIFPKLEVAVSYFEKRLHVIVEKTDV